MTNHFLEMNTYILGDELYSLEINLNAVLNNMSAKVFFHLVIKILNLVMTKNFLDMGIIY